MGPEIVRYAAAISDAKHTLGASLELSDDLLHVHLGLLIFVLAALVTRRRMRSWWPLGVVTAFAVVNEIVDYLTPGSWSARLSALDLLNTLVWPSVLFLLARRGKSGPAKVA